MKFDYNKFDLSHEVKMSFTGGKLYPILVQEVLPGDRFRINLEQFVRAQPMIAPLMQRVDLYTYAFYVQQENIWNDAEEFYTRGRDNTSTVTVPRLAITNTDKALFAKNELSDYMGIPPIPSGDTVNGTHYISALPFWAYQNVYNEIFRNPEVEDEIDIPKASGDYGTGTDLTNSVQIRNRMSPKSYFTMGKIQAVLNPDLNAYVPTRPITDEDSMYKAYADGVSLLGNAPQPGNLNTTTGGTTDYGIRDGAGNTIGIQNLLVGTWPEDYMGIGIDIDDMRRVSAMQRWLESMIRSGYRYPEYLKGTWQVKPKDGRLDRPEYLGGGSIPLRISEVLNTSATATEAQGEMAGHGIASGRNMVVNQQFTEHGWIIVLVCAVYKRSFHEGIDRIYTKFDYLDYANPFLANLGAQNQLKSEVWYDWEDSQDDNMGNFCYVPRYSEYKMREDRICGDFREELMYWTMAQDHPTRPNFNTGWLTQTHNADVFASTDDPYLGQFYLNISALRKLPVYANLKID